MTLVITRADVRSLLDVRACIDAVEQAFLRHAVADVIPPAVVGAHVPGGGFHVKTAGMQATALARRATFVAKVNSNFPDNPGSTGLPTIQGVISLFDAANGELLAILDSMEITNLRTAAATAVAAKYLARAEAGVVTVCGCGEQGRSQLRAIACVRGVRRAFAYDVSPERSASYARDMTAELGIDVVQVGSPSDAIDTDIWITCTTARQWLLGRAHVSPGAFVAAVGADNPEKQEIEPELLAASAVVADILAQCAAIGDLHHALDAGVMQRSDVRAELADVVSGRIAGRCSDDEIVVFDSTGTALEDVAAATLVYERAMARGLGLEVDLAGRFTEPLVSRETSNATARGSR